MNAQKTIDDLAREERLAYFRDWRARNKDKVRASNKRYWEKRALERQRQQAKSGENNDGKQ